MRHLALLRRDLAVPALYVSHDMTEIARMADHVVVMEAGRSVAAAPLDDILARLDLPLAQQPDAREVLAAEVLAYDEAFGLSSLAVRGGVLTVPGQIGAAGQGVQVQILATDVSLCRVPPEGTSIQNILPCRIARSAAAGPQQVNVLLGFGADGNGDRIIARITRKSWESLGLAVDDPVYALIKGASLVERSG